MTISEWVEKKIKEMFLELTELAANGEFGEMSEDEMCAIPLAFFRAGNELIATWRKFVKGEK